ncbi:MAG TPA: pyrroloquinoline quinone precursor peptide PqqA [Candidatus Cybelea sp.]|nr:pyrroloquinoline quinone precursor peptide PqqA [Candidatus Cybelea sp.]
MVDVAPRRRNNGSVRSAQPPTVATPRRGKKPMWKTPKIVEVAVGLEINSYACALVA